MRVSRAQFQKLQHTIKELRIHLCPTGEASKGARDFVQSHYPSLKKNNPSLPILIRECQGVQPRLWIRYELGKESSFSLTNQDPKDVLNKIQSPAN